MSLPAQNEHQERHSTPEPQDDPLSHESYVVSPLDVIVASLDEMPLTLHDLTEAWTVAFSRLRSRFPCDTDEPIALRPFKANMDSILRALDRDVRRALVNPITRTKSNGIESDDDKSPKRGGLTEYEVTYARDLFMLSSASLRFLSLIFWVPQLYSLIPGTWCTTIYNLFSVFGCISYILT